MMKNLVLAFLFFQADVDLRIIKSTERGFNKNINELKNEIKNFSDNEKCFVILIDQMKIQPNLVWDKHTGRTYWVCRFGGH